jgi:co-chaperonin GroES (HSP10)
MELIGASVKKLPISGAGPTSAVASYAAHASDVIEEAVKDIDVSGWRILIVLPKMKERTDGGVYVDPALLEKEKLAACVGYVAKVGPDAYSDKRKFPTGPWCKEGQWILFKSYSGTRIQSRVGGIELRILNDDTVEGVIHDVTKYTRV